MKFLDLPIETKILDLACGQGRHSVNFNKMGYNVTGVDISKENIFKAKKYENNSLSFGIHDMRNPMSTKFDLIVNLFTSFGYFEEFNDNLKTLSSLKLSLNDFKDMFKQSKIEILHIFGDYKLNKFDINKSKRLIFIFK